MEAPLNIPAPPPIQFTPFQLGTGPALAGNVSGQAAPHTAASSVSDLFPVQQAAQLFPPTSQLPFGVSPPMQPPSVPVTDEHQRPSGATNEVTQLFPPPSQLPFGVSPPMQPPATDEFQALSGAAKEATQLFPPPSQLPFAISPQMQPPSVPVTDEHQRPSGATNEVAMLFPPPPFGVSPPMPPPSLPATTQQNPVGFVGQTIPSPAPPGQPSPPPLTPPAPGASLPFSASHVSPPVPLAPQAPGSQPLCHPTPPAPAPAAPQTAAICPPLGQLSPSPLPPTSSAIAEHFVPLAPVGLTPPLAPTAPFAPFEAAQQTSTATPFGSMPQPPAPTLPFQGSPQAWTQTIAPPPVPTPPVAAMQSVTPLMEAIPPQPPATQPFPSPQSPFEAPQVQPPSFPVTAESQGLSGATNEVAQLFPAPPLSPFGQSPSPPTINEAPQPTTTSATLFPPAPQSPFGVAPQMQSPGPPATDEFQKTTTNTTTSTTLFPPAPQSPFGVSPQTQPASLPVTAPQNPVASLGGRPPCAVMAFGFGGKLLQSGQGVLKEQSVKEVLEKNVQGFSDIEEFPGPFGHVDFLTTQRAVQHMDKLAKALSGTPESISANMLLRFAGGAPHSAALLCNMLACLLEKGGKVESDDFWAAFLPKLSDRGVELCPKSTETSSLQTFCRRLASGDAAGAFSADIEPSLWHHALIIAPLAAPEAYHRLLSQITTTIQKAGDAQSDAAGARYQLNALESKDPMVQAVLLLYEAVGKQTMPEISDAVLDAWPAYAAVFCGVLRASSDWGLAMSFLESVAQKLIARGDVFGAHLCYLLTGRTLEPIDGPASLVVLLGVDHRDPSNFGSLLEPLAMQLSETYEYALRCGDQNALCATLQPFKLVHARVLADLGMTEKAARYQSLTQAFAKAMPQSRLSEAFRASMRDFNEQLNPSLTSGNSTFNSDKGNKMGGMLGLFRGVAEATGFVPKPTPPPALLDDEDDVPEQAAPPPIRQPAVPSGTFAPVSAPTLAPVPAPPAINFQNQAMPTTPPLSAPPMGTSMSSQFQAPPPLATSPSGYSNAPPPSGLYPAPQMPFGSSPPQDSFGGDGMAEQPPAPKPPSHEQRFQSAVSDDPLINAAKGMFSFGKSLVSKFKGDKDHQPDGTTDSQQNTFYYDEVQKRWRQRGVENEPTAEDYDPMTGKLKPKPVDAPPPVGPPMGGSLPMGSPPPMGGPPMMGSPPVGGPPLGPPMGGPPIGAPPMGGPPMGGPSLGGQPMGSQPPSGGGLNALMSAPPPGGVLGSRRSIPASPTTSMGTGGPLASPFGGASTGVRASPFG